MPNQIISMLLWSSKLKNCIFDNILKSLQCWAQIVWLSSNIMLLLAEICAEPFASNSSVYQCFQSITQILIFLSNSIKIAFPINFAPFTKVKHPKNLMDLFFPALHNQSKPSYSLLFFLYSGDKTMFQSWKLHSREAYVVKYSCRYAESTQLRFTADYGRNVKKSETGGKCEGRRHLEFLFF